MNILNLNAFQFEMTDLFAIHEIFLIPCDSGLQTVLVLYSL